MFTFSEAALMQTATGLVLVSTRIFGMLLIVPMFAFRQIPLRFRITLALVLALIIIPSVAPQMSALGKAPPTVLAVGFELAIGVFVGFLIRLGLMAIELAAEVLSIQTGLSFATNYTRDPAVASGLMGEFLALVAIAVMFAFNLHLLLIDLLLSSFTALPFGQWPTAWDHASVLFLVSRAFQLGLILSMPTIVVYLIFYIIQAILARTSPQFNLFSVGFAITVPLAFLVLILVLPDLPAFVGRALDAPMDLVRRGLLGQP